MEIEGERRVVEGVRIPVQPTAAPAGHVEGTSKREGLLEELGETLVEMPDAKSESDQEDGPQHRSPHGRRELGWVGRARLSFRRAGRRRARPRASGAHERAG